ncbi:DNA-damage inducible protein DDI1-like protein [Leishmania guyanensis]
MVQLTINNSRGITLCRVSLPASATVQQLWEHLIAANPKLGRVQTIRNEVRQVTHHLPLGSSFTQSGISSTELTLLQAGLVGQDVKAETLVVLMAPRSTTSSLAAAVNNARERIVEMFDTATGSQPPPPPPPAVGRVVALPPANVDPHMMDGHQVAQQQRMYAQIQQQQIDENLANALEYTPEAFAGVSMLYVPCVINKVPLKAFVDSGAQNSIMNKRTAEQCGLMRLVDVRMRGVAVGVGRQEICGRIHMATVNLAGMFIPFAFYVIEDQTMDLIIGLDQLRRHQMIIDLKHNSLIIDSVKVSFLPERDLPTMPYDDELASAPAKADHQAHGPRRQNPSLTTAKTITTTTASAPAGATLRAEAAPAASALAEAPVLSENERLARIQELMTLSGITDRKQAVELLEAADWDTIVAAALLFDN